LPLIKKIGITSHRISQNTTEFCIDLHWKISYNFAKFGPFSVYEKKKTFEIYEISSTRNVVNTLLTVIHAVYELGFSWNIIFGLDAMNNLQKSISGETVTVPNVVT